MFIFPYVDSDLGYWYIIWKVNTRNTFCTMLLGVGIWFHVKPELAWMQVNRLGVEGNYVMLPCHSCYIYWTWRSKNVGSLKSSYGGKGVKPQRGENGEKSKFESVFLLWNFFYIIDLFYQSANDNWMSNCFS